MNAKLFIAPLLAAVGLSLVGCKAVQQVNQNPNGVLHTNTVYAFDAQKTIKVMHQVVPNAVVYANTAAPQYRQFIVDAQVAACGLVGSTNVTPDAIRQVFAQTGVSSIQTPEIQGVTVTVYGLYSAFYDNLVTAHLPQTEIVQNMTLVLQGLCNDLTQGLVNSPPPAPVAIPVPVSTVVPVVSTNAVVTP